MKKIVLMALFSCFVILAHAQKTSQKTIDEICKCTKGIDKKLTEDEKTQAALVCMSTAMTKNMEALMKEYGVKGNDPQQMAQEVGRKLGIDLVSGCPEIMPYLINYTKAQGKKINNTPAAINPDTLILDPKVCAQYKTGKYKCVKSFLERKEIPTTDTTAYSEVKDGFLYDYSNNKKNTTKWSIRWISACEWEQTMVETNEPNLKEMIKKGDKIVVKAIGSTLEGDLWFTTKFFGLEMIAQLKKIK